MKISTMTEQAQQYLEFKRNLGYQLYGEGKEFLLFDLAFEVLQTSKSFPFQDFLK